MESKPRKNTVWIVVLVIVGLLASCLAGAVAGGLAGYVLGRKASQGTINGRPYDVPQLTPDELEAPDIEEMFTSAALITRVVEDSPAEEAGLRVGDMIVSVDGVALSGQNELASLIQKHEPGDKVRLQVARRSDPTTTREVRVTLGVRPDKEAKTAWLGVEYVMVGMPYRNRAWPERPNNQGD